MPPTTSAAVLRSGRVLTFSSLFCICGPPRRSIKGLRGTKKLIGWTAPVKPAGLHANIRQHPLKQVGRALRKPKKNMDRCGVKQAPQRGWGLAENGQQKKEAVAENF